MDLSYYVHLTSFEHDIGSQQLVLAATQLIHSLKTKLHSFQLSLQLVFMPSYPWSDAITDAQDWLLINYEIINRYKEKKLSYGL